MSFIVDSVKVITNLNEDGVIGKAVSAIKGILSGGGEEEAAPDPLLVAAAVAGVCGSGVVVWRVVAFVKKRQLEEKRTQKRRQCEKDLEDLAKKLKENVRAQGNAERIANLSLCELVKEMKEGKICSVEALEAFQYKAMEAHHVTHCLVEPIKEAEEMAQQRDTSKDKTGLLHGVPISLKEHFAVKGYDSCLGLIKYVDKPSGDDAVMVKVLKSQGAVPFIRTNVPHMAFSYTTRNPIFGITRHPTDHSRGPGGSSGGESALIASQGSPLGWGSDLGGSIRNPAHFCGICGLKPTGGRLSTKGNFIVEAVKSCMPIVIGPMSRDVDGLVLAMRALLVPYMFELDKSIPPIPFRTEIYENTQNSNPLRIGYYTYDGLMQADPSCVRAVDITRELLQKNGHELVEFELPLPKEVAKMAILGKILFGDGGKSMLDAIEGDHPMDNIRDGVLIAKTPCFVRWILSKLLWFVDRDLSDAMKFSLGVGEVFDWWQLLEEVTRLRSEFEAKWAEAGLHAIICPAFSCPAMPVDFLLGMKKFEGSYLQYYNLMDMPAGTVPVTTVSDQDLAAMDNYPQTDSLYKSIKEGMDGAKGLPVGVQVVTGRWEEELCLRIMKEIETGIASS